MNKYKSYAPIIVRIGMSLVFLWFGTNQLFNTINWLGVVPYWASNIFPNGAVMVILLNGWFEIVAGLMLIIGLQTRIVSLLLALHLLGIASAFGFSPIGIRDFGLAVATASIFFAGADMASLDGKFSVVTEP